MMKRLHSNQHIVAIVMVALLAFGLVALFASPLTNVATANQSSDFAGGDGSPENPYQIETWNNLDNVRDHLNNHFILIADLDSDTAGYDAVAGPNANNGEGFEPIGSSSAPLTGSFDGNGHEITGLYIDQPEAEGGGEPGDAALFIAIDGATIADVELSGATISGGDAGEAGDNNRASDGGAAAGFVIDISNAAVTGVSVHDSTITAGDGGARGVGISGGNGGFAAGFAVESDGTEMTGVTVSESTIIAGAGGLGGSSAFGNDGGDGGDGGYAAGLIAVNTGGTIEAASVTDVIVETADGGDGGDGGDNEDGDGGDGGNGGDGGYAAGLIVENHGGEVLDSNVDFDVITAGDGGNGGAAGSDGGISHSVPGNGGDSGAGGHAAGLITVNTDGMVDGAAVSGHSNSRATAGNGGDGGPAANVDGGDNDGGDGGDGGDAGGLIAVNTGGAVSASSVEIINSEAGDGGDGNESGPAADKGGHGGAGGNAAGLIATNIDGEVSASSVSGADSYGGTGGDGGPADNYAGDGGDAGSVGGLIGVHFGGSVTDSSVNSDSLDPWESTDVISFNGGIAGDGNDRTTIGGDGGDGGAGGSAGGLVGVNEGTVMNSIVDGLNIESGYGSDGGAAGEGTTNDDGTEGIDGEDGPRGGLVGTNSGMVTGSTVMDTDLISKYAGWDDDSVDSDGYAGGLVGVNTGTVAASAGSDLWVENEFGSAAGLIGKNEEILRESYIAGNSEVAVNEGSAAGAVGVNDGTVENTYVTDTMIGVWTAGSAAGFVSTNAGTVEKSYVGDVEFWLEEGAQAAGFAGTNTDAISASYWDTDATDESVGVRSGGGAVTGLLTGDMTGGEALNAGNMDELGVAWETVDTDDWDTNDNGYPILESLARLGQLEAQGLDNVVTISGTVSEGGSGEPIEGAEVSVTGTSLSELTANDITAEDGTYELTVADDETYELTATATVDGVEILQTADVQIEGDTTVDFILYPELDGYGTEEAPYEISTALELQTVQQELSANYILVDDVDAAETAGWNAGDGFDPIDGFEGTFDGDGYEIQRLTIDRSQAGSGNRGEDAALFGTIEGATITHLGIVNATISAGDGASGADGVHNPSGGTKDPEDGERGGDAAGLVLESIGGVVAYSYVVDSTISAGAGGDGGAGHTGTWVGSDAGRGGHAGGIVLENGGDVIASYVLDSSVTARSGGDGGSISASSGEEGTAGDGGNVGAIVTVNTGDVEQTYSSVSSIDAGTAGSGSGGDDGVLGGIAGINHGTIADSYWDFGAASLDETDGVGDGANDGVTARTTAELSGFNATIFMEAFDFDVTYVPIESSTPELESNRQTTLAIASIDTEGSDVSATSPHLADGSDESTVTVVVNDTGDDPVSGLAGDRFDISVSGDATVEDSIEETDDAGVYEFTVSNTADESVGVTVDIDGTELSDKPTIEFRALVTISGTVTDGVAGGPLEGVTVEVIGEDETDTTASDGSFELAVIDGATYEIIATDIVGGIEITNTTTVDVTGDVEQNLELWPELDGSGIKGDPFVISNDYELQVVSQNLSAYYVLGGDIDASDTKNWNDGDAFEPIGDFSGMFDGANNSITGLLIDRADEDRVGLFANTIEGAEIRDLQLVNANITGSNDIGDNGAGSLVGFNEGDITNVSASGDVTADSRRVGGLAGFNSGDISDSYATVNIQGEGRLGGLVGENNDGNISGSHATGEVTGNDKVGGLVGWNAQNAEITESYATGEVTGLRNVGGLVGWNDRSTIKDSSATGTVTSDEGGENIGGLIGMGVDLIVVGSRATGDVVAGDAKNVGGLIGYNDGSPPARTVKQSFADVDVIGDENVGGLIGKNKDDLVTNSYAVGNVTGSLNVGGLAGYNTGKDAIVTRSYATGSVSDATNRGGLVGLNDFDATVENAYWNVETTGQSDSDGGTGLRTVEMAGDDALTSLVGFDSTIWTANTIYEDGETLVFPYPTLADNEQEPAPSRTLEAIDAADTVVTAAEIGTIDVTVTDSVGPWGSLPLTIASDGGLSLDETANTTDTDGMATFAFQEDVAGIYDVSIVPEAGDVVEDTATVTVEIGAANSVTVETQPDTTQIAGETLTGLPAVAVTDQGGNPVEDVVVTAEAIDGSATLTEESTTTVETDSMGLATFDDLVIETAGELRLEFSINDSDENVATTNSTTTQPFDVEPAEADTVAIETQPDNSQTAGEVITGPPQAIVTDRFGNPIEDVVVTADAIGGDGALTAGETTVQTGTDGIATFDDLEIEVADEDYRLSFSIDSSDDGIAEDSTGQTERFDVEAADAATLNLTVNPELATAGETINFNVSATDQFDNPARGQTLTNIELQTDDGEQSIHVPSVELDEDGTAEVPASFSTNEAPQTLLWEATADGVTGDSQTIEVVPAEADSLSIVDVPGSMTAGESLSLTINATDQFGNPAIDQSLDAVTITSEFDGNVFAEDPLSLDSNGETSVTVPVESITTADDNHTLTIDVDRTFNTTVDISVASDEADTVAIETDPDNIQTAGEVITGPPEAIVTDRFNNPVSGVGVNVAAIDGSGSLTAGEITVETGNDGSAIFDDLVIETADEYRLAFSIDGDDDGVTESDIAHTTQFTVEAVAPASLSVIPADATTIVSDSFGDDNELEYAVSVEDEFGNSVPEADVEIGNDGQQISVNGGLIQQTDSEGNVTFTVQSTVAQANVTFTFSEQETAAEITTSATGTFEAGAPASINASVTDNEAIADGNEEVEFTVTIEDEFENPVGGAIVTVDDAEDISGISAGDTAETGDTGEVTFAATATTAGEFTVQFSEGAAGSDVATATFLAGEPASITVDTVSETAVADSEDQLEFKVTVTDANSNPVGGAEVTADRDGSAIEIHPESLETDADGAVTFTATSTTAQEAVEFVFTEQDGGNEETAIGTFVAGDPYSLVVEDTIENAGEEGKIRVVLEDAFENRVPDQTVRVVTTGGIDDLSGATVSTNETGEALVTFTEETTGDYTVTFDVTDHTEVTDDATVTITAAGPDSLFVEDTIETAGQEGTLTLTLEDAFGNPVPDETLEVTDAGGIGQLEAATTDTAQNGAATLTFTETTADTYTITVGVQERTAVTNVTTVTVQPADADSVAIETYPEATQTAGTPLTGPPAVLVTDEFSNPVDGVDVTVEAIEGDGSLTVASTTTIETNSSGIATFSDLVIETSDAYRLVFRIDGDDEAVTESVGVETEQFTVESATADSVRVETHPDEIQTAGVPIMDPPEAIVTDRFDNPVDGVAVTVDVTNGAGSIESGAQTVATNVDGVASFGDLVIETADDDYRLEFSIDGSSDDAQTDAFNVVPTNVDSVSLSPDTGATVTAGDTLEFTATALDEFGNLIEERGNEFTWQNATADGTFENTTAGTYVVTATFDNITSEGVSVTVIPAAVDAVAIDPVEEQTIRAGQTVEFNATAYDRFGNLVEDDDTKFTWINTTEEGTFTNTTSGSYTVTASLADITSSSVSVMVDPAAVDSIELDSSEGQTIEAGSTVEFTATAFDQFGNLIEKVDSDFTWENTSLNGTFKNTTTGTYIVTAELDGVTSNSVVLTVKPTDVDAIVLDSATSQTIEAGETIEFNATAYDRFGNFVEDDDTQFTWINTTEEGTFTNTTSGSYTVMATLGGVTSASVSVMVDPAAVDSIELKPDDTRTVIAGEEIVFNATAYDEFGNVVENTDHEFAWTNATDDGVFVNTTAGAYVVTATFDDVTSAGVSVTVTPAAIDAVAIDPAEEQTIRAGETLAFTATAVDEFNNLVEEDDSEFTWQNTTEGLFETTTAGVYTVSAELDGISNSTTVTVDPAAINNIELDPADEQTITAGHTLEFNATAFDEFGNTNETANTAFTWSNTTDMGRFEHTAAGTYRVSAASGDVSAVTTVAVDAATADTLSIEGHPDIRQRAGNTLTGSPTVLVTDAFDNPIAGETIAVGLNDSSPLLGTTRVETTESGIAIFDGLSVEAAGSYRLVFENTSADITASSNPFTVDTADPTALSVDTQPGDTVANESIAGPPTVTVTDAFGNPVADETVSVSLADSTALHGPTNIETDAAGHAVFDSLRINAVGEYTLEFTLADDTSTNAISETFEIMPADVGSITAETHPTTTQAGALLIGPPTVTVTDTFGNPLSNTAVDVRANNTDVLDGTTTVATNTTGVATFESLQINRTGDYTLIFETADVTVITDRFDVTPAAPDTLNASNTSATAGTTGAIDVQVTDEFDNTVGGVTLTATDSDGLRNLSETAITNTSGVATFTFNESVSGTYTPTFVVASNSTVSDTATVTISHSTPETVDVTANANTHTVSDDFTDDNTLVATVTLTDAFGNTASDAAVNMTDNGSAIEVRDGRQQLTDEDGVATFAIQSATAQEAIDITFTEQESGQHNSAILEGITFEPAGPQASGSASSYTVNTGTDVTFRAGTSTVPDGSNPQYEWTFDDGTTTRSATGITNTTRFDTAGTVNVTLTVTVAGESATDSFQVTVEDRRRPNARLTAPTTVGVNQPFSLDATASTDNVGIANYQWDFGNGTVINGSSLTETTGIYTDPGEYDVVLTATDTSGNTDTNTTTILAEGAVASLSTDRLDFGAVGTSSVSTASFRIENDGTTALNVSQSEITGDNASAFWVMGEDTPQIRPDESRSLTVAFEPTAVGTTNATLTVTTENNTGDNQFDLTLTGTGIASNLTAEHSTAAFGDVDVGTSTEQNITIENTGTAAAAIDTIELHGSDASQFSVSNSPSTIEAGETATVTVTFSPQVVGSQSATLHVETTSDDSAQVAFSGRGDGPQLSVPSTDRSAGSIGSGTERTVSAQLRNYGTQPLNVTDLTLTGDNDAFEITTNPDDLVITPDSSAPVLVTFKPEQPGDYSSTIEIEHNDTTTDAAEITVSGTAVAADISVDQRTLDFGRTEVGQPEFLNLTISNENNAGAALTITRTSIVGGHPADFSVDAPAQPFVIDAGEERDLRINFTALDEGQREAQLQIESDANQGQTNIWLTNTRSYILVQEVSNPTVNIDANNLDSGSTRMLNVSTPSTRASMVTIDELGFTMQRTSAFEMNLINSDSAFDNAFTPDRDTELIQYVGLDHVDHLSNETFENTSVVYRVNTDALRSNVSPDDVGIHRYDETIGAYVELDAVFVGERSGQFHYEVETPGFSEFAITVTDAPESTPASPAPSTGSGGTSQPAPIVEPQPDDDSPRDVRVDVTPPESGAPIRIDGESAGTGAFLSGVETFHADSLVLTLATDRPFSLDLSTYDPGLTPSFDADRFDPETEAQLRDAAATFETQTETVSAGYLSIGHDLAADELSSATIAVSVQHSYLSDLGADPEAVVLYRETADGWVALPTEQIGETESHVQYESITPGFSVFAVGTPAPVVDVTAASLTPQAITAGETATVSATVTNRGHQSRSQAVSFGVDGEVTDSESITIDAGETITVGFEYTPTAPGEYALSIGNVSAGTLTVSAPIDDGPINDDDVTMTPDTTATPDTEAPSETGSFWWLLIVFVVLAAIVSVLWRFR